MMNQLFCQGGGCTAKLGPGALDKVLKQIPRKTDEHLLVGYDSADDAAVYKLTDDLAIVQTLDFFPPMVEDPYLFGQIAAANALSDIYAMGADVKTALNIVCFPEKMDLNILGQILLGGSEKVIEAGGILAGGHSIVDEGVKYGLSVTGTIHPDQIYKNNSCRLNDRLILTKPLGTGIVMTALRMGVASDKAVDEAVTSMCMLNKKASEILRGYQMNGCTDITGFGFAAHLCEMLGENFSASILADRIPVFSDALTYADEFYITAAGQRNRNHVESRVRFEDISFAMEEILFDPQTSGGLLASVKAEDAKEAVAALRASGMCAEIVGEIIERQKETVIFK
ncbi:MAG: selenide, water dikinase SelD [Lachnospiraceae bacterium]